MRILINDFCGHASQIELSREFARRGHSVLHTYFADNTSTPKGDVESGHGGLANFSLEGLHVPMKFSKHSILTRRSADIAYGREVASKVVSFSPDVVISANMPLDAQAILQRAVKDRNAKFIFSLQDVYSFAVRFVLKKKLGILSGIAGAYYERMERRLLKNSDAVICIAPEFAKLATKWKVLPSRIFIIENWAAPNEVLPTGKDNAWSREQGLSNGFCFMYSGTLGMKHRPELLLALARDLEVHGEARLVVIAGGAGAEWLQAHARSVRKEVLMLLPFQPYKRISEVLGASDVLIALLDSEAGAFAVPSKILSYLCAGRTLMVAAPRENHVTEVVERADAGVVVSPDDAEEFVATARKLIDSPELRTRFAANARAYAERTYNIASIADRFLEVFEKS